MKEIIAALLALTMSLPVNLYTPASQARGACRQYCESQCCMDTDGDGICDNFEDHDCPRETCPSCGQTCGGVCGSREDKTPCPDCGQYCGGRCGSSHHGRGHGHHHRN